MARWKHANLPLLTSVSESSHARPALSRSCRVTSFGIAYAARDVERICLPPE
jgi:hypothetical protein